jgi:hypothetical protein
MVNMPLGLVVHACLPLSHRRVCVPSRRRHVGLTCPEHRSGRSHSTSKFSVPGGYDKFGVPPIARRFAHCWGAALGRLGVGARWALERRGVGAPLT